METLSVYSHLWPNDDDVARPAVEWAWELAGAPQERGVLAD
jgi:hypothetical protein